MAQLVRSLASVFSKTPLFSGVVRPKCLGLCNPLRLSSHVVPFNQNLLQNVQSVESESQACTEYEEKTTSLIISKVNKQVEDKNYGRLFAVIYLNGKQFKITTEDIIVVDGYWPPDIGDKIYLKKVLLIGGSDFTLIGCPMLPHGLVTIEATAIEKTMSHTKSIFRKKRRKQYMRINFKQVPYTIVRINSIEISDNVNVKKDVEGLESIF